MSEYTLCEKSKGVNERQSGRESSRGYQLICQQEDSLETKLAVAKVEEILQTGPEEIEDHGVVVTFSAEPANEWDADATSK